MRFASVQTPHFGSVHSLFALFPPYAHQTNSERSGKPGDVPKSFSAPRSQVTDGTGEEGKAGMQSPMNQLQVYQESYLGCYGLELRVLTKPTGFRITPHSLLLRVHCFFSASCSLLLMFPFVLKYSGSESI